MTPTPDPIKTIEELVTSVYHEAYKCGVGARPPHAYRSVEAVIKEATQAINNEMLRARIDELEQLEGDHIYTMISGIPTSIPERLNQLKQSQTGGTDERAS